MTDEQLLRKLAEIEGLTHHFYFDNIQPWGLGAGDYLVVANSDNDQWHWNPLIDGLACISLQESHDVWTESDGDGWHGVCDGFRSTDPDLKRAICLAIVESAA